MAMLGGLIASVVGLIAAAVLLAARQMLFRSVAPRRRYCCMLMKAVMERRIVERDSEEWHRLPSTKTMNEHNYVQ